MVSLVSEDLLVSLVKLVAVALVSRVIEETSGRRVIAANLDNLDLKDPLAHLVVKA